MGRAFLAHLYESVGLCAPFQLRRGLNEFNWDLQTVIGVDIHRVDACHYPLRELYYCQPAAQLYTQDPDGDTITAQLVSPQATAH